MPKLEHLLMSNMVAMHKHIDLVTVNSLTLVTLKLVNIITVPKDIQWPVIFPSLKALKL